MFYNYVELEDGTQVAYSNVLDDGIVEVSIERPIELGFDSARCMLPTFEWTDIDGFDDEDLTYLDSFIHNNAPFILRLAREASKTHA